MKSLNLLFASAFIFGSLYAYAGPVLDFYEEKGTTPSGHKLRDVMKFDNAQLEKHHDYIQLLIPTKTVSKFQSAVITDQEISQFKTTPKLMQKYKDSIALMSNFYGFEYNQAKASFSHAINYRERFREWIQPESHDFLRLTRIIESLMTLGLTIEAKNFFSCLEQVYNYRPNKNIIGDFTYGHWKRAAEDRNQQTSVPTNAITPTNGLTTPESWSENLSNIVNKYFGQPYKSASYEKVERMVEGRSYTVYRPNHALAHGLRQGFLAVDIVEGFEEIAANSSIQFASKEANAFMNWVAKKLKTDPNFKRKVEFASVFQRSGREQEGSSSDLGDLYDEYERADARYFETDAKGYVGKDQLFKDDNEVQIYKEAILWSTAHEGKIDPYKNEDLLYLRKILHAAHHLDLRRMRGFDINRMKASVVGELFGDALINKKDWAVGAAYVGEKNFMDILWNRSGDYLYATGDRDVEDQRKDYHNRFFTLSSDPKSLTSMLYAAKDQSLAKF